MVRFKLGMGREAKDLKIGQLFNYHGKSYEIVDIEFTGTTFPSIDQNGKLHDEQMFNLVLTDDA